MVNIPNHLDTLDLPQRIYRIEQMWDQFKNDETRASPFIRKAVCDILEGSLHFYLSSFPSKDQVTKKKDDVKKNEHKKKHEPILVDNNYISIDEFLFKFNERNYPIFGRSWFNKKHLSILRFDKERYKEIFSLAKVGNRLNCIVFKPISFIDYVLNSKNTTNLMKERIINCIDAGVVCLKK